MVHRVKSTLHWLLGLGKAFARDSSSTAALAITLAFLSQLCMVVAFFLPIKVIMLLGESSMPVNLPKVLQAYETDILILWLCVFSLIFYGAMHWTRRLSERASELGVKKLLSNDHKPVLLFDNQEEVATNAFLRFSDGVAGICFTVTGILLMVYIYHEVAIVLMLAIVCFLTTLAMLSQTSMTFSLKMGDRANDVVNWLSDVGFLVVFVYIVLDFLYFDPPDFILAIFAVILVRILLGRLQFSLNQFLALKKQEHKINALFFQHGEPVSRISKNGSVWDLVCSPRFVSQLRESLWDTVPAESGGMEFEFRDTNARDVAILIVKFPDVGKRLLVKLYGVMATTKARHEANLLLEFPTLLPAPKLVRILGIGEIYRCHIFDVSGLRLYAPQEHDLDQARHMITERLALIEPSLGIIDLYKRSRRLPWDRIDQFFFQRIMVVASESELEMIYELQSCLPAIIDSLASLPLTISVPISKDAMIFSGAEDPMLTDWTGWELVPLGADMFLDQNRKNASVLMRSNQSARILKSNGSVSLDPQDIELAALVGRLLSKFERQRYREIIDDLLPRVIANIRQSRTEFYGL